jgi:hypothetical protein
MLTPLQASIEYMRYLEQCLSDLKSAHAQRPRAPSKSPTAGLTSNPPTTHPSTVATSRDVSTDPPDDHIMPDIQPTNQPHQRQNIPSISPALLASAGAHSTHTSPLHRPESSSSIFVPHPPSTFSTAMPSPSFERHGSRVEHGGQSGSFALTSPAIPPMQEDQEATAALLMLNTDRRSWSEKGGTSSVTGAHGPEKTQTGSSSGRGMSVKDLLSG